MRNYLIDESTFYTHSLWQSVDLESIQIEATHDLQLIPSSSVDLIPCDFGKTSVCSCSFSEMQMYSYLLHDTYHTS